MEAQKKHTRADGGQVCTGQLAETGDSLGGEYFPHDAVGKWVATTIYPEIPLTSDGEISMFLEDFRETEGI